MRNPLAHGKSHLKQLAATPSVTIMLPSLLKYLDLSVFPEDLIVRKPPSAHVTRSSCRLLLVQPFAKTSSHLNSFIPHCISLWNSLPAHISHSSTLTSFKTQLSYCNLYFNIRVRFKLAYTCYCVSLHFANYYRKKTTRISHLAVALNCQQIVLTVFTTVLTVLTRPC